MKVSRTAPPSACSTHPASTRPSVHSDLDADRIGLSLALFAASLFANYTGPYHNRGGSTVLPLISDSNGNPAEGGDKVNANTTVDMHLTYSFESKTYGREELYLEGTNIFDRKRGPSTIPCRAITVSSPTRSAE